MGDETEEKRIANEVSDFVAFMDEVEITVNLERAFSDALWNSGYYKLMGYLERLRDLVQE